eukprot:GGOE01013776.1.p2 GENE.GGOE01013776.1~~GGOE01013776.1.p2  ORF type:complete len:250 (+),score=78.76 GGOE01013776.1:41-790(+)
MLCRVPRKATATAGMRHYLMGDSEQSQLAVEDAIASCLEERNNTLRIQNTDLKNLPEDIGQCTHVSSLAIIDNFYLTNLPASLAHLHFLDKVVLTYNALQEFPGCLLELELITLLDLSNNEIPAVPRGISGMKGLRRLVLDNNCISAFPPDILRLTLLRELCTSNNPLVREEMQVDSADDAVLPEEYLQTHCAICMEPHDLLWPVFNFTDFAGLKDLPVLYPVCSAACQKSAAELGDSETLNYSKLVYI